MKGRRQFLRQVAAGSAALPVAAAAAQVGLHGAHEAGDVGQLAGPGSGVEGATGAADRAYWVRVASRLAEPVLTNLAARRLKATMPVEAQPGHEADRAMVTHLEALGRLLAGIAPWLESGAGQSADEARQRTRYADLARQAIDAATDPASPDALNFTTGGQPLVDAAFLSHAVLRAPRALWADLPQATRARLVKALVSTRVIKPPFNNWLLFSAMVEAALCRMGEWWDPMRVDYAIRQHEQWYKGDGVYGDGPQFHWDYYNSFVIQPMLLDVLAAVSEANASWKAFREPMLARARRYAAIQERLVAPDGSFPAVGRSLAYRCGAFQGLAHVALARQLPDGVSPAQARGALSAVIRRTMDAPGTFDDRGWLTIGVCGHQRAIGETYISTGSLYLCSVALLPLGLPGTDPFWTDPAADWTSKRVWRGDDVGVDHAI